MKILVVQNRMGIGDMVIFLPFVEAISKKFNVPVSLLVKENTKAHEFLKDSSYIDKIMFLDRSGNEGVHSGLTGFFKLSKEIKKQNFDKIFIFNSSLRFNLLSRFSGIKNINQYPLFRKKNQHIISTAQNFLKKILNEDIQSNPKINMPEEKVKEAKNKYKINENKLNIILGIGGSGNTKRIPSKTFIKFMELSSKKYDCNFYLATGNDKKELDILNDILNSDYKNNCKPLNNLKITEILPIFKNCKIAICNDSSFSHLSAALGIKTIVLMADTPLIYGNYSPRMYPIIPDGEMDVTHNTLGKDKINPERIFGKFIEILS